MDTGWLPIFAFAGGLIYVIFELDPWYQRFLLQNVCYIFNNAKGENILRSKSKFPFLLIFFCINGELYICLVLLGNTCVCDGSPLKSSYIKSWYMSLIGHYQFELMDELNKNQMHFCYPIYQQERANKVFFKT